MGEAVWSALRYSLINRIDIEMPVRSVIGRIALVRGLAGHQD